MEHARQSRTPLLAILGTAVTAWLPLGMASCAEEVWRTGAVPGSTHLIVCLFLGLVPAAVSLTWLFPMLCGTRIHPAAGVFLGVCVPISVVTGFIHPFLAYPITALVQILAATYVKHRFELPPMRVDVCASCGYSLEGLTEPRCPECGAAVEAETPT